MDMPASWQAALPHKGSTVALLNWWKTFNDPTLSSLLQAAEVDNPTLAEAAAAIASARASRLQARAAAFPAVDAEASLTHSGTFDADDTKLSTLSTGMLDASWEIDLFGAVRHATESAAARLEAAKAEWHDARVSLAAEVASEYINYKACQLLSQNQQDNLDSLRNTERITLSAVKAELQAPSEEILARASVASAAAALNVQQTQCELDVKAMVALTGIKEPVLRKRLTHADQELPSPDAFEVTTLPIQLLSQRPDLVAAERRLAAASAEIGVAEANRYPRFSLLGSIATEHSKISKVSTTTDLWSFGPSLSVPLLDGGALRAQVTQAQASYDAALATYKSAVRKAVKETEQSLIRLGAANRRCNDLTSSARDYRGYYASVYQNWLAGGVSLLTLEVARRDALLAEQRAIAVQRDQILYGIALYKALGGGWQSSKNMDKSERE